MGPTNFPEKLIPLMIQHALTDKNLPVYGQGLNVRDWIYVEDHCLGIEAALFNGREGEVYNFGGNEERQNIEVVSLIKEALNSKSEIIYVTDRLGHDFRYAIDSSKASKDLNWKPQTQFEDGIKETINWYQNNPTWLDSIRNNSYQKDYV